MKHEKNSEDDRAGFAKSIDKASQIFSACLMMVLPAVGGNFLDQKLQTPLIFTFLGFFFGLFAGFFHIWKLINTDPPRFKD